MTTPDKEPANLSSPEWLAWNARQQAKALASIAHIPGPAADDRPTARIARRPRIADFETFTKGGV